MTKKYYAVKTGKTPGIYDNWEDCKIQVEGYPKAEYKSFKSLEDAEEWMGTAAELFVSEPEETGRPHPEPGCAIAYVDGSFSEGSGLFSYGVVFFYAEEELHFSQSFNEPDLLSMRNVAGEIMGAGQAMKAARKLGCRKLSIFHDYEGIAKWCTGEWKANKDWTKAYKRFYDEVSSEIEITFSKVKAHSKDPYNDLADQLAKDALSKES